jgi:hypothetical protein
MSAELILNLISEALDGKYILEVDEADDKKEVDTETGSTLRLPRFQINEKDWGQKVDTEDRTTIERIGKRLPGKMPMQRVAEIQKFLDAEVDTDADATVGEIMAKLMFLDLFAACVLNFNESVAGFLFESLFAGIFKGFQIPAKEADTTGDIKIPDLKPEEGEIARTAKTETGDVSYSFKLLTDGGTSIGGSMHDLFNGVCKEGKEIYLVGLKSDQGEDSITINMYEFPINEDNWFKATAKYTTTTGPTFEYESIDIKEMIETKQVPEIEVLNRDNKLIKFGLTAITRGRGEAKEVVGFSTSASGIPYLYIKDGEDYKFVKGTKNKPLPLDGEYFIKKQTGEKTTINLSKGSGAQQAYGVFMPGGSQREAFKKETGKYFEELILDPNEYKDSKYKMFDKKESPLNLSPAFQKRLVQFSISQKEMKEDKLGLGVEGPSTIILDRTKFLDAANRNAAKVGKEIYQIFTDLSNLIDSVAGYFLAESASERNKLGQESRVRSARLAKSAQENLVDVADKLDSPAELEFFANVDPEGFSYNLEEQQLRLLMKEVFGR